MHSAKDNDRSGGSRTPVQTYQSRSRRSGLCENQGKIRTMKFGFHPEAEAEFLEAIAYYESSAPGLGEDFSQLA
jgi:hypothetical protein